MAEWVSHLIVADRVLEKLSWLEEEISETADFKKLDLLLSMKD